MNLHDTWSQLQANEDQKMEVVAAPHFQRRRAGSCNTHILYNISTTSMKSGGHLSPSTAAGNRKRSIIPKRKAPPPPIKYTGCNRASSVPTLLATDEVLETSSIDLPREDIDIKSPPCKPPRTQSTYVTQDGGIFPVHQAPSDYEPLIRPGLSLPLQHVTTDVSHCLLQQLQDVFNDALTNITSKYFSELMSKDRPKSMEWADITVCIDLHNQHQLYYHMQPITLEVSCNNNTLINLMYISTVHVYMLMFTYFSL